MARCVDTSLRQSPCSRLPTKAGGPPPPPCHACYARGADAGPSTLASASTDFHMCVWVRACVRASAVTVQDTTGHSYALCRVSIIECIISQIRYVNPPGVSSYSKIRQMLLLLKLAFVATRRQIYSL